jgi:hypothetical protein
MNISERELLYKKKIGDSDSGPVVEFATKGGWHYVAVGNGNKLEQVAVGPHRGVARFIAKKKDPSIVWSVLEKSEELLIPPVLIEKYERVSDLVCACFERISR